MANYYKKRKNYSDAEKYLLYDYLLINYIKLNITELKLRRLTLFNFLYSSKLNR